MNLWIRSQNKTKLVKVDVLQLINNDEDKELPFYINTSYDLLGAYKTKERALEVLDEIQNYLINNAFAKKQNGFGETIDLMQNPIFVYTMPKE